MRKTYLYNNHMALSKNEPSVLRELQNGSQPCISTRGEGIITLCLNKNAVAIGNLRCVPQESWAEFLVNFAFIAVRRE